MIDLVSFALGFLAGGLVLLAIYLVARDVLGAVEGPLQITPDPLPPPARSPVLSEEGVVTAASTHYEALRNLDPADRRLEDEDCEGS